MFTPSVLTILGVIMFLRFGEITGQAGVRDALLILLAAKAITSLTAISLAAIATNTWVKSGGAYYLISRSLGVEFGGGIAFVLYFAQAISVALYVIGFAEAFVSIFPDSPLDQRTVATIANVAVGASVLIGAGWTIRLQYLILAVLLLSLVSFGLGAGDLWSVDRIKRSADRPEWTIPDGEIHVWWPGRKNGPLMLILTHLFLQNLGFRRRTVRVIHAVPEEAARDEAHRHLTDLATSARIDAAPLIVVTENLREALLTISRNAGVVVLGFDVPAEGEHIPFFQDIEVLTEGLGDVMLVASARPLDISA